MNLIKAAKLGRALAKGERIASKGTKLQTAYQRAAKMQKNLKRTPIPVGQNKKPIIHETPSRAKNPVAPKKKVKPSTTAAVNETPTPAAPKVIPHETPTPTLPKATPQPQGVAPEATVSNNAIIHSSPKKISYSELLNQYRGSNGVINSDIKQIADLLYHEDYDKMMRIIQSCTHDGVLNTRELNIMTDLLKGQKYNDDIIAVKNIYDSENIEYMRSRIYDNSRLSDEGLQLNNIDKAVEEQLSPDSKYRVLGQKVLNKKTQQRVYMFENLRDAPDMNGLRAKNPLNGGNKKLPYIKSHLEKLKQAGIKTIIDFRAADVCSPKAIALAQEMDFKYVRFTIDDTWTLKELQEMAKYIEAVNEGNFIAGCANGQARTDLAMAINYVFNPKAKNAPQFYYGNINRSSRVSVRDSINKILNAIEQNPEVISQYGWKSYDDFITTVRNRIENIL